MVLHICIVYNPRKRHFDFGFKGQGLEYELYIVSLLFFFWGGGGGGNVKRKGQIYNLHIAMFLHNFWVKRSRPTCSNLHFELRITSTHKITYNDVTSLTTLCFP